MMAKTQITLETEMQRRARQRANDLGVSLASHEIFLVLKRQLTSTVSSTLEARVAQMLRATKIR